MATSLKIIYILFFTASLAFGQEVRLNYKTGEVADIVTEVFTDFNMKLGDKDEMRVHGLEKSVSEVQVIGKEPFVDHLPLTLAYKLKSYKVELAQGDTKTVFDIETPNTDFLYAELKQLKDKEVFIVLNQPEIGFLPRESQDPLAEILRSKKVSYLILNHLREPFFLAGQLLTKGQTVEVPIQFGEKVLQEGALFYKITAIDEEKVQADITFTLPRQRKEREAILISSGQLKGEGTFQRKNGLNFTLSLKGQFHSALKAEDKTTQTQTIEVVFKSYGVSRS